jgi:hypothetical protein
VRNAGEGGDRMGYAVLIWGISRGEGDRERASVCWSRTYNDSDEWETCHGYLSRLG